MSEDKLKKIIAFLCTILCGVAYAGGYIAGIYGWWFATPLVLVVYFIIINRLHHH